MLTDIIPTKYRKTVYAVFAIGGVILGVWQIVGLYPEVRTIATDVWVYVGAAFGFVAHANTQPGDVYQPVHSAVGGSSDKATF